MTAFRHLAALLALALLPVAALAGGAFAQAGAATGASGAPTPTPGYTLQAVEGGVLKLDTRSGALSFCSAKAGAYVCEAVPEDRAALEAEITRLQARIAELEKGRAGVPDIMAPPAGKEGAPDAPMTEEARKRLDEALDVAEHAFRRFMDMVNRLRSEEAPQGEKL